MIRFLIEENEWDVLKSKGLESQLNYIFTDEWQKKLLHDETEKHIQEIFEKKLGKSKFEEVDKFRIWLDDQEEKSTILAYLQGRPSSLL